ncbi:MAG TPA: hypothetical protein V6C86_04265 [Oculatellaceae cyanobacterium]
MNILIDRIINCLHWLDMFFPGKQDKIDWKEVGQMRHRLVSMRFAYQAAGGSIDPIVPVAGTVAVAEPEKVQTSGSMLSSFRVMNGKSRDRQALTRWYTKEDHQPKKEKALSDRIESVRRAHEERQASGCYPAISTEELATAYDGETEYAGEAEYQVEYRPLNAASEAQLKDFLTGHTDDINTLLFTNINEVKETAEPKGLAAKFPLLTRFAGNKISFCDPGDALSEDSETIAALEEIVKIDAVAPAVAEPTELEPISLPADIFIEPETSNDEDSEKCTSMAAARERKAKVSSGKKSRRRK